MNTKYILAVLAVIALGFGVWFVSLSDDRATDEQRLTSTQEEHHADEAEAEYEMYPGDVAERMASGEDIILLDVRTLEEYEEIHLENALLLPVQELSQQTLTAIGLGEDTKDKEIILYCRSGARSKTAYNIMTSLGYTNVKSVAGGMIHWEEDNYPFTEVGAYDGPATANSAAIEDSVTTGPKASVDRTMHEFGVIPQSGGTVAANFTVTNSGTEVLEIGQLTTSCSCTSATISSSSIEPGEETELTVVFDPDFHEEPVDVFKRTVFIPTNDPNNPELEVAVQMDIAEGE
jgi:rhodanese-related sulfurtransferase